MDGQPPTVAMLWESSDPHQALTERFGFPDASDAVEWIAEVLEEHWALELTHCGPLVISDRNVLAWIETADRRLIPERAGRRLHRRGTQLVHNDRSANLLHDGDKIRAVLDFEEIKHDTRQADLGKSAVLLATQYRDWEPTSKDVRAAYIDAYNDHGR